MAQHAIFEQFFDKGSVNNDFKNQLVSVCCLEIHIPTPRPLHLVVLLLLMTYWLLNERMCIIRTPMH